MLFQEVHMPSSNDQLQLTPQTDFDGAKLEFDFPGVQIGVAEYTDGPTGCTVIHFPNGAMTAIDVRGGMPGVSGGYEWCHAICLAGGSLYGLEAASGVHAELFAQRNYALDFESFPLVNGAIIFDFGGRENRIYPDKDLGRAALRSAREGVFPLGARGVGRSANVGSVLEDDWSEPSGQGGAFRQIGEVKVAVFIVVNALGLIHDRSGQVVRGNRNPATGERLSVSASVQQNISRLESTKPSLGNTTLTVVVTNQKLDAQSLTQLGRQVHTSLARVIYPFHTLHDGDVLYAVTTNEVQSKLDVSMLGLVASELAWDAVLSSIPTP
jgi:L-aminopeptidase/D-esterase-like protein